LSTGNALLLVLMLAQGAHAKQADNTCEKSITWLEARGESAKGIAAVRQVIRNRSRRSGEGACKIVKRKGQFSSYRRGMKLSHVRYDKKFLLKWDESGTVRVLTSDYLYYFRKDIRPEWARKMTCDRVVGNHRFCRDN
jgi:spore germination cell wall hydrolase CwlJ-like protein